MLEIKHAASTNCRVLDRTGLFPAVVREGTLARLGSCRLGGLRAGIGDRLDPLGCLTGETSASIALNTSLDTHIYTYKVKHPS